MNPILLAARAAAIFHEGQTRKYDGSPYIVHPGRVAARMSVHPKGTEAVVCAAWLHDVIEDCRVSVGQIANVFQPPAGPNADCSEPYTVFGTKVADLVWELTNPSKKFPSFSRDDRKAIDRAHIVSVSQEAKMIKLADRTDNLRDVKGAPTSFIVTYFKESILLLDALRTGHGTIPGGTVDEELEREFKDALAALKSYIPLSTFVEHAKKFASDLPDRVPPFPFSSKSRSRE
jgi:(p)ppGpp synthase/HD superfamily hydrolase